MIENKVLNALYKLKYDRIIKDIPILEKIFKVEDMVENQLDEIDIRRAYNYMITQRKPEPIKPNEFNEINRNELIAVADRLKKEKEEMNKTFKGTPTTLDKIIIDSLTDNNGKVLPYKVAEYITDNNFLITIAENDKIYYYSNGIYKPMGEIEIKKQLKELLQGELTTKRLNETMLHIKIPTYKSLEELEENKNLIHLKNGIFNIKTMQVEPFSPEKISFTQIPIEYSPKEDCPAFKKFLGEITNSKEDYNIIQEMMGYMLYKAFPFHKIIILVGEGANGKSTLINAIKTFLGQKNISAVSIQDFDGSRFRAAAIQNKLANLYPDIPDKEIKATGAFKALTGGDTIQVESKFKEPYDINSYAKMIFSCNKMPRMMEDDDAIWRRLIILNFENKFEGKNADENLLQKITTEKELSGIFNFSLEGLKRLLKQRGFSYSKTKEEVRQYYIKLSDPTKAFFIEKVIEKPNSRISKEDLYGAFIKYCQKNKLTPIADNIFAKRIISSFAGVRQERLNIKGDRMRVWAGIDLIPEEQLEEENKKDKKEEKQKLEVDDLGVIE